MTVNKKNLVRAKIEVDKALDDNRTINKQEKL